MSVRQEKAPDMMEQATSSPACVLCRQTEADLDICGHILEYEGISVHVFCLFFATEICTPLVQHDGLVIFYQEEIERTIEQAAQKECFVCHQSGATITCLEEGCDCSFHLPCAVAGRCVTQYFGIYRSYCPDHCPKQEVEVAPQADTECLVCMEPVDNQVSYRTMVCPVCKHAWFHRDCIQGMALRAGIVSFQCPICRDQETFVPEMFTMGIRIPIRMPMWEDVQTLNDLIERHSRCDASECLCPGGREQAEEEGPWQLLLCCSCAAEGTHRRCSSLRSHTANWECNGCAGPSTAASASLEQDGPGTDSQSGSEPSDSSLTPNSSSPISGSQTAPVSSDRSSMLEDSSFSGTQRQMWVRVGSRLQRQAQTPYSRPRRRRQRSCMTTSSVESSTPSLMVLGSSHDSLESETSRSNSASQLPSGASHSSPVLTSSRHSSTPRPVWMRIGSRLQSRARTPYSRPRRGHRNSRAPSSSAGPHPPPPAQ